MQINRNWLLTKSSIVFLLLLSPLLEGFLIQGVDRYKVHPEKIRKLDYIGETIYRPGPPIDFLFLGPSTIWASINARLVQNELRRINKNETISVENFSHNHIGTDLEFVILKDLVENRGLKTLFLGMPPERQKNVHREMRYIWNPLTHSKELNFNSFARLYSEKLLDSIPNIARFLILPPKVDSRVIPFIRSMNGSLFLKRGYVHGAELVPYEQLDPPSLNLDLRDVLKASDDDSLVPIMEYFPYQEHFLRKILKLTKEHGINVYILLPPTVITDYTDKKFKILTFMGSERIPLQYIGLNLHQMFPGGNLPEIKKFYFDAIHMNRNGSDYFTKSLIRPLQEIYETTNL